LAPVVLCVWHRSGFHLQLPVMVAGGAAVWVVAEREEATCKGDHWYKELKQHAREIIDTRNCQRVRCVILQQFGVYGNVQDSIQYGADIDL
jgi:hypothetical protein